MKRFSDRLSGFRATLSPHENHLVDGFVAGRVSRRDFMRHGSVLGLSVPLLGQLSLAAGLGAMPTMARAQTAKPGATIRVGNVGPTREIDPIRVGDNGAFMLWQQVGEFLCNNGTDFQLEPVLATSWKPNHDGTVWTFNLRKEVKFHSGREVTADDVVATFDRLTDPSIVTPAGAVFKGILQKGGARKRDDYTVEFHLDAPIGAFPYLVSSDNYNAIILPASYAGDFEKTWDGTGPFKIEKFTTKVGASFVRNEQYWGPKALPARTEVTFYESVQPQILALKAGQVDLINIVPALDAVPLMNDPAVNIMSIKSTKHHLIHMRCDTGPFKDARVRRALALALDRDKLVQGLLKGRAIVGNDSPFAPYYPSADTTVPQRKRDIPQARELLKAAGVPNGFQATLPFTDLEEAPAYAQLIQSSVKEIGIDLQLQMMDYGSYVGPTAQFGGSPWLDSSIGIFGWGNRGIPNIYLSAQLMSDGRYAASHFNNSQFDSLTNTFFASLDVEGQRSVAGKIQRLLLDETPAIYAYFSDKLTAAAKGVVGAKPNAFGQIFLQNAGKV